MTLLHPIWLALAIPLLIGWWWHRSATGLLHWLRLSILLLVLLALCGLAVNLPSRHGTIIVVADRSLSMPPGSEAAEREAIELIQRAMSSDDRLAVISFGQTAAIERAPQTGAFAGFTNQVGPDASHLAEALDKALALIPANAPGKILVISDGHWTGKDPASLAAQAAARGVAIDYRLLQRAIANDLAIAQIDAPVMVTPGEAFMLTAWVKAPATQEITYELRRSGQLLAAGKTIITSGLNRLTFRDQAGAAGAQSYVVRIASNDADLVPENNVAKILVGVQGPRPLLIVAPRLDSGLARLLSGGGVKNKVLLPEQCEWSLDWLAQFAGVIIENVPAEKITVRGMEIIAAWVTESGAGLMMTGGKGAYGPGGYFQSPLAAVLPVSMELRQEHRKLALAIVVAMDRSGSMTAPVGGGRTKMDLANLAAAQVLTMLAPLDEFGVVAVDSSSHIVADLQPIAESKGVRERLLRVDAGGGGIFVYEALTTAAEMLLKAKAGTRHIILFADAADAEEPGQYQELLRQCEQAGITVSVIGLGKPSDPDAALLRDIAGRGHGQIYFTESAAELPRLFAQDTIILARSTFLEQPTPVQFTGGMITLTGKQFTNLPPLGGYNLCYLRPQANLAAVTNDEYQAPVIAAWQAGGGRALCYTGEADGQFIGQLAGWQDAGELFSSLARWTAGDANLLPSNMLITQEVSNGLSRIQLHLDPERDEKAALTEAPEITTLRVVAGSKPSSEKTVMRWATADTLEAEVPLQGAETALSTLAVPSIGRVTLAPVTLPYSPEFKPLDAGEGETALARLAQATGGRARAELAGLWRDLPRQPRLIELGPWLLLLAVLLLLIEVLERHTGLVTAALVGRWQFVWPRQQVSVPPAIRAQTARPPSKAAADLPAPVAQQRSEVVAPQAEPAAMLDALRRARQQAKERTER